MSFLDDDPFNPLWLLLEITDEGLVDLVSSELKKQGCYALEDLAFFSVSKVKFPPSVKPIVLRKFKTVCQFYAQGHKLESWMQMKDVLKVLSGQPVTNTVAQALQPVQQPQPQQQQPQQPIRQRHQRQRQPPPPPQTKQQSFQARPVNDYPSRKVVNIIIHADFTSSESSGQVHLREFQSIRNTRIVALITSSSPTSAEPLPSQLLKDCQIYNIPIYTDLQDMKRPPPLPSLFVIASNRIHDTFWLLDNLRPSAVLLEVPPRIPPDSLRAMSVCANEHRVPIYLHIPRTVAKFVQNTLETSSCMPQPSVVWKINGPRSHWFPEFVIAVMFFGIKVESVSRFQMDPGQTVKQQWSTEYERAAFRITTLTDVSCSFFWNTAVRKASNLGVIQDAQGRGIAQHDLNQTNSECATVLKARIVRMLFQGLDGDGSTTTPIVVPTIQIGIEAARLQAYAEEHLDKAMEKLKPKPPSSQRRSGLLRMFSTNSSGSFHSAGN